jgi:glycosyltransferase involved in cell wall biosynthesis
MKVLFFTHHFLDDNSGGSFASRAYVNAFTEISDSCMLMYPDSGKSISQFIHKKCILKGVKYERSNIGKVIDYYRGRIHRYTDIIIPQIQEFQPDIVVFDNSRTTAGILKIVKKTGPKIITIHHNYEIEYYKGTKQFIAWRYPFMHYMKEAESTAVLYSDLNLTLTDEDTSLLQIHYDPQKTKKIVKLGSFESSKNSISNTDKEKNLTQSQIKKLCFVITGTLGSYQTEVSVIPFLENEYPELLKLIPGSRLIIAGHNPSNKLKNVCSKFPSVQLIADPENMQEIIARADVYICPTCVGGGLKLRIMDGLKAGLPVITHEVSARGYTDFSKANSLFIYHNKETFRESVNQLMDEINKGNLNNEKIKGLYKSVFSFESGVKRLKEIMCQNEII